MEKQSRNQETETKAWRQAYKKFCQDKIPSDMINLQNVFTPFDLCYDMVRKLEAYSEGLKDKTFCVFNLEFAEALCYLFGIERRKVWFVTDCEIKKRFAEAERYNGINTKLIEFKLFLKEDWGMKFDCVIMNPPYQSNNPRNPLWKDFVIKALSILKKDGFLVAIHPASWRKPDHKLFNIFKNKQLKYLEIHNHKDGKKIFGCGTRYDWYILENIEGKKMTIVVDENGVQKELDISKRAFISNTHSDTLEKCLVKKGDERCEIIYSSTKYETRKPWMSKDKKGDFKYPCVHSINRKGIKFWYSNTNAKGDFGVKKVIFYDGNIKDCFFDKDGKYGMTQHAFSINVKSDKEAEMIKQAVSNPSFQEMALSMIWAGFAFDFRALKYFRKDFWKEFNEHS